MNHPVRGQWECAAMKGVDVLRDQYGNRIGEIQIDGSKQVLVDRYFVSARLI